MENDIFMMLPDKRLKAF